MPSCLFLFSTSSCRPFVSGVFVGAAAVVILIVFLLQEGGYTYKAHLPQKQIESVAGLSKEGTDQDRTALRLAIQCL